MPATDAGEHGGDMPVPNVERLTHLAITPGNSGQAPLQGRDR
jgi:hypothetical protein